MSEYYESLGSSEKDRYIAKLEAVTLTLEHHPNSKQYLFNLLTAKHCITTEGTPLFTCPV